REKPQPALRVGRGVGPGRRALPAARAGRGRTAIGGMPAAQVRAPRSRGRCRRGTGPSGAAGRDALDRHRHGAGAARPAPAPAARPQLERGVALCRVELGPDDPRTVDARNSLVLLMLLEGRHAEAIPEAEETLAARRRALGDDAPPTLASWNNLAAALAGAGQ